MSLKIRFAVIAAFVALVSGLLAQRSLFAALFSSAYLPHRYCYLARPVLVWTNVSMDGLIAGSYATIFICLFWVAGRLKGVTDLRPYLWILISFGTFILACGATHMMEFITVWWPLYPLAAAVKVVCAAASVPTAILFARATPVIESNIHRFLEMVSTTQQEKDQALRALVATEKLAVAGRISASIAHEVKSPLESIGNILNVLENDVRLPADLLRWIHIAETELNRATNIAQNTLSLYREAKTPVKIALEATVMGVLELQAAEMVSRNISLEPRLRTTVPLIAYSSDFPQILINLVQNAAAAIGRNGRIFVRVQPRHLPRGPGGPARQAADPGDGGPGLAGYSITIADNGCGIDPLYRERLFTLFFTTKGDRGNGVGLWLVRSIVEKHGGRMRFRSRTGSESRIPGTVFNIWLPLAASSLSPTVESVLGPDSGSQPMQLPA